MIELRNDKPKWKYNMILQIERNISIFFHKHFEEKYTKERAFDDNYKDGRINIAHRQGNSVACASYSSILTHNINLSGEVLYSTSGGAPFTSSPAERPGAPGGEPPREVREEPSGWATGGEPTVPMHAADNTMYVCMYPVSKCGL
jgi:hypothetical protein